MLMVLMLALGGDWMVVEADESDGTFNRLPATLAVVTNIDPEHLDHWGNFEMLRKGFLILFQTFLFTVLLSAVQIILKCRLCR